jgi:hypothetical protein
VRASLRAHVQEVYDLDEVVSRVNQALWGDTRENEFASLWYGVIDPAKLRLTYCSAGHEPPFVVHMPKGKPPTEANISELSVGGMVVGIDPAQRYQRAVFDLRPRDLIVVTEQELALDLAADAAQRGRGQNAFRSAAASHVDVDPRVGVGSGDHTRDVAVGDQLDAASDLAKLGDDVGMARPIEHARHDLARLDALHGVHVAEALLDVAEFEVSHVCLSLIRLLDGAESEALDQLLLAEPAEHHDGRDGHQRCG